MVKENSKTSLISEEFNKAYEELSNKYETLRTKQDELEKVRNDRINKATRMKAFLVNLGNSLDHLDDWNNHIWMTLVESGTVHRSGSVTFKLNNGHQFNVRTNK